MNGKTRQVQTFYAMLQDNSRYSGAALRDLRKTRGCSNPAKLALRAAKKALKGVKNVGAIHVV